MIKDQQNKRMKVSSANGSKRNLVIDDSSDFLMDEDGAGLTKKKK